MIEIVMPRLSDSMEEGTILAWLVADGDMVHRGDELLEVETDKAAMVHMSDADGVLKIIAPVGSTHAVGDVIASLLSPGEAGVAEPTVRPAAAQAAEPAPPPQAPSVVRVPTPSVHPSPNQVAPPPTPAPQAREPVEQASVLAAPTNGDGRIHASPVARRLAAQRGIDLESVSGTGPNGRIVRADVEAPAATLDLQMTPEPTTPSPEQAPAAEPAAAPATPAPATESAKGAATRTEPTRSQSLIARRMSESRATIPDFTLEIDVDASRLADIRSQLRDLAGSGRAPSVGDLITRASALALAEHPNVNGSWRDGGFERYERVNIGIAVATDGGLVVPVIFDADRKDINQLASETADLAARARAGTITPPELSGGTFSVSNLGMFGVDRFTAVINPPQSAILAVGAMRETPVVHDGEVVPGQVISLNLAVDHRSIYGADAAKFLATLRELLEAPAALLG
jgi:pyruvate dehydrogenase E2 component (dihydrolipoamide acetyltransferase)